jgi:ribosomal protein S2
MKEKIYLIDSETLLRERVLMGGNRQQWGSGILFPVVDFQLGNTLIFKVEVITYALQRALVFLNQLILVNRFNKILLVFNGRIQSYKVERRLREVVKQTGFIGHTIKWIPGMFSNFNMYSKFVMLAFGHGRREQRYRFKYWQVLGSGRNSFLRNRQFPSVVIILGCTRGEYTICNEARIMGIPVIGVLNSDCDYIESVDYPLFGSDTSSTSLFFYFDVFNQFLMRGVNNRVRKLGEKMKLFKCK